MASEARPRILLTHSPEARATYYGARAEAALRELGEVVTHAGEAPMTAPQLIEAARGCRIIVCDRATPGYAELFAAAPDLTAFVRGAVDIRTIDVEAASRAGVLVTRASPGFVPAVTELVLGFMVDLARGITAATADYHAGNVPQARMGTQLQGSTLGVIGYGSIGRSVARLGQALGMRVLVNDPYAMVEDPDLAQVALDDLLAESDFVVPLAVATEETENLMSAARFARMKRGAFLINVSRGNLVDEAALADALRSGHLAGAALDVGRAPDQMPSPEMARLPNVLATPHTGGLTPTATAAQAMETVAQVAAILRGEIPKGAVNAERATRLPQGDPA